MSKVGMVAQDFKPSIWEADVGRSLSLRLAQSIYRASSRISRTTQRNPISNRPPPVCVCLCVCLGEDTVCVHLSVEVCGVQRHQYSEMNWLFSKSTICS